MPTVSKLPASRASGIGLASAADALHNRHARCHDDRPIVQQANFAFGRRLERAADANDVSDPRLQRQRNAEIVDRGANQASPVQGARWWVGVEFSVVIVISDADPFHLSARSASTGCDSLP
jgi:hypothetical protein